MPSATRIAVKNYFETGDIPTQAQFYQWLDGAVFIDELAELAELLPLTNFVKAPGTVTPSDTYLTAINKLVGNTFGEPLAIADGATLNIDASLTNTFHVTIAGNRTLGTPTNPRSGQKIVIRIKQDGVGSRTITPSAIWRFGTDISSITLSTTPNKADYIGAIYNLADDRWDIISFSRGY